MVPLNGSIYNAADAKTSGRMGFARLDVNSAADVPRKEQGYG